MLNTSHTMPKHVSSKWALGPIQVFRSDLWYSWDFFRPLNLGYLGFWSHFPQTVCPCRFIFAVCLALFDSTILLYEIQSHRVKLFFTWLVQKIGTNWQNPFINYLNPEMTRNLLNYVISDQTSALGRNLMQQSYKVSKSLLPPTNVLWIHSWKICNEQILIERQNDGFSITVKRQMSVRYCSVK